MVTQLNIQCFVVVARCLNFSQAAEQLFMSRQGVSQQVKALEDSVGTPLFERRPNKIVLTAAGKSYLEIFSEFLENLSDMRSRYTEAKKGAMPVRIGIMRTLNVWDELYRIGDYCRELGLEADIQLNVYEPPELVERLRDQSLDIAFSMPLPLMRQTQNYGSFLYIYLPQVMLIQKGHPVTRSGGDVCDEALKILPVASWSREATQIDRRQSFVANWNKSGREIQAVKEFPNADTASIAAESGVCADLPVYLPIYHQPEAAGIRLK